MVLFYRFLPLNEGPSNWNIVHVLLSSYILVVFLLFPYVSRFPERLISIKITKSNRQARLNMIDEEQAVDFLSIFQKLSFNYLNGTNLLNIHYVTSTI
jgi:hypothetical protein